MVALATVGSTLTLANQITANTFTNTGSSWVITGTTPPVYILNSPYSYSFATNQTTVTPVVGQPTSLTVDSVTVYETGIKIVSSTASLTQIPLYDQANKKLTLTTSALGVTSVYLPSGKPISVNVDGSEYVEDVGFTWSDVNQVATQIKQGLTIVWTWTTIGGGGGDVGNPPPVNPPPPAGESKTLDAPAAASKAISDVVYSPSNVFGFAEIPTIISTGLAAITFIMLTVIATDVKGRRKPSQMMRGNNAKQVKWRKPQD